MIDWRFVLRASVLIVMGSLLVVCLLMSGMGNVG